MYLSLQFSFWSCVASSCWATLQHFITTPKGHPNVKLNTHAQILFQVDIEQSDKTHRPLGPGYSYAAGCDVLPGKPHSPIPCGDPRETFAHMGAIAREPHPDPVRAEDEILEGDRSHQSERKYFHKFQLGHLDAPLPPAVTGFHSRHVREIPPGSPNSSCGYRRSYPPAIKSDVCFLSLMCLDCTTSWACQVPDCGAERWLLFFRMSSCLYSPFA